VNFWSKLIEYGAVKLEFEHDETAWNSLQSGIYTQSLKLKLTEIFVFETHNKAG